MSLSSTEFGPLTLGTPISVPNMHELIYVEFICLEMKILACLRSIYSKMVSVSGALGVGDSGHKRISVLDWKIVALTYTTGSM